MQMKVQKNISISVELATKLSRIDNVSELVERLLWAHLAENKPKSSEDILTEVIQEEDLEKVKMSNAEKFFVAINVNLSELLERPATKIEIEEYIFRFKNQPNVNLFDYAEELKNAKQQLQ